MSDRILYEQDFYLWLPSTAILLKEKRFEELVLTHLNAIKLPEEMSPRKLGLSVEVFPINCSFKLDEVLHPEYLPT
ncbi:MAG TPA: hypothetical protein DDZ80_18180 [Cyanobacteria bacterium UBA8803]|nr:hypothetical protein [Cyanobacteria bacterium UBA9273]HBL60312.1 hypothetical protein [Cyanobacteria bacterium UBA8803]